MFGVNGWSEDEGVHVAECFNGGTEEGVQAMMSTI